MISIHMINRISSTLRRNWFLLYFCIFVVILNKKHLDFLPSINESVWTVGYFLITPDWHHCEFLLWSSCSAQRSLEPDKQKASWQKCKRNGHTHTHTRIFFQLQASSLKTQTHSVKMEREVNEGEGGTCVTLLAMQKTSLSMCFPTSTIKKEKVPF